jgi:hypothetical protein
MGFDLTRIGEELRGVPLASPYPPDLSAAIVNDAFRLAGLVPLPASTWNRWTGEKRKGLPLRAEQAGMLAHLLAVTSLRAEAVAALSARPVDATEALTAFFDAVEPLTAEMVRANAFRQEEFLRRWIESVGGRISGETPRDSKRRLEQLDYRKTMAEYARAEKARKDEAKRRKELLAAQQREADARGWRE